MRQIEKEGYAWANREILTIEQAEEYIAGSERRRERLAQTARAVGITDRAPGTTEAKFLSEWIDMGFDDEMIELAYDKTLTNTGGLKWGYMNGILKSWHEKGLHTPQDVREKDARRTRGKAGGVKAPKDIETLIAGLDKI
jgi:DnaD/phage-associated family protein